MTVLADDKSIEKKDKTAGEPVQFYVKGSTHMSPYEIVVFDVGRADHRLSSTPKSAATAAAAILPPNNQLRLAILDASPFP